MSVLAIAGCSGGSSANGPKLTRTELVTRANAICTTTGQQVKDGAKSVFAKPDQAGIQDADQINTYASTVVIPALQKESKDLHALSTNDSEFRTLLGDLGSGINRWKHDHIYLAEVNDTSFAAFDSGADDFGLKACGAVDGIVRTITTGAIVPLAT